MDTSKAQQPPYSATFKEATQALEFAAEMQRGAASTTPVVFVEGRRVWLNQEVASQRTLRLFRQTLTAFPDSTTDAAAAWPTPETPDAGFRWMPTLQIPIISLSHVSEADIEAMEDDLLPATALPGGEGFIAHLPPEGEWPEKEWPDFDGLEMLQTMHRKGYRWIMLDPDGAVLPGVTTFKHALP